VGFHGHDDFGMATANALSALEAGATAVDASLLGAGERAGIAATERLGAFLAVRRGLGFGLEALSRAARLFAQAGGIGIPPHAPVVGERIFACETGLHVEALAREPALYEPFAPERVGTERKLLAGGKSGIAAIRQILSNLGEDFPVTGELVTKVREVSERLGRPLETRELVELARAA
jgi:homocitrate synthase NifV